MRPALPLILLLVCLGHAQEAPPQRPKTPKPKIVEPDPPLGAGVIARIDGVEVTMEEYRRHLQRRTGMTRFQKFLDEVLVARKARDLGIEISNEELEAAVDRALEREVEQTGGDLETFRERLRKRFYTLESYRQMKLERLRPELLLERCVLRTRTIDEDDVKEKFEEMFGVDGITHRVRHIMISQGRHGHEQARTRADEVMEKLARDPDLFAELVAEYSDHGPTRRSGGVIAGYRPGGDRRKAIFGENFDRAVQGLERAEQITGPVRSADGFHIIQLLERKTTQLEDVAGTIRDLLVAQDPTPAERRRFIRELQAAARIEMDGLATPSE